MITPAIIKKNINITVVILDDLFIYFGFRNDKWSFIPSLNYERHGVIYNRPPEVKMEIRFDFRYNWKDYRLNIFYERE